MTTAPPEKVIQFYGTSGEFGFLSNFFPAPIEVDGKVYATTEAYFQAMKFPERPDIQEKIRQCTTPMAAKKLGGSRKYPLRKDWEDVKDGIMWEALQFKFSQHPNLHGLLLATKESKLVEHTARDHYWGDGGNGSGLNRLGELLTELRDSH